MNRPLAICPTCAAWAHNPCGYCGQPWPPGVVGYTPRGELSPAGREWFDGLRSRRESDVPGNREAAGAATVEPATGALSASERGGEL